jgi:hypothetical protein
VINEHGERFLNYDAAFVIEEHCDPARVGNDKAIIELRRCVVTAAPCLKRYEGDRSREEDEKRRREEEHR